jgi:sugar phosphate isomerase/epimerase
MSLHHRNRRHFITNLCGLGLGSLALAQSAKLKPEGENIRFGMVTYNWGKDWDLATLLDRCGKAGVQGVELRVEHAHGVTAELTAEERSKVRAQIAESGVELIGMGTNFEFHSPDAATLKKNIEGAKAFIRLSHDVGGSGVKVKPNALPKEVPVEKTLEQIGKALAELGDYSLGFGQEIRLEIHGGVSDQGHVRKVMEVAAADNVRVCWNSNDKDLEGDGIERNFAKVQDFLGHTTHIRELGTDSKYPYETLAKLLVAADYDGWVCLEGHKPPAGDRIQELAAQRTLWGELVAKARA